MYAKCPNHNIIRIEKQRRTCPMCGYELTRASMKELKELGEMSMDRARAARCLIENQYGDRRKLASAGFMAIFHGTHYKDHEISKMMKD